ncbi:MAG TPA: O-antigen ligase family protein [Rhizomicrobium sp.]
MPNLASVERMLWTSLLLAVPVSATPLLPFGSGTLARPLAAFPAALILLIAAFRMVFLRQKPLLTLDGFRLLGLFSAYILVSGLVLASLAPPELFKGQTPMDSFFRALITWSMGLAFYLTARLNIRSDPDIRHAQRCLFIGMGASIAFAAVQLAAIVAQGEMLRAVQAITDLIAVHYDGLKSRAQGMTFEPSWLASQIIVFLMPTLIASSISRQDSVGIPASRGHELRLICGFTIAIGGLLCSGSRFGLVCIVVMLVVSGFMAARRGHMLVATGFLVLLAAGGGGLKAMSSLGAGAGASYVVGPVAYLVDSTGLDSTGTDLTADVSDTFTVTGRIAAAQAAGGMWLDHPLFGVSLGNDYRYFSKYAPDWAFATGIFTSGAKEGEGWLDPNSPEKGNAKNFFLRLLAETGLIGFLLFGLFLVRQIFFGPARDDYHAYFRLASLMALGFGFLNQDTFVETGVWIPLALCFAMNRVPPREAVSRGE